MIEDKKKLRKILKQEKNVYYNMYCSSKKDVIIRVLTKSNMIYTYKYVKLLRKCEYYYERNKFLYFIYRRRKNKLGMKLGIEAYEYNFDENLIIYHPCGIVINRGAKIGKNCQLHGNNCIGNNGKNNGAPIIGDNVDIGVGAKIIGNIELANNIKVGAGAVVTKSCLTEGATLVGIPARELIKEKEDQYNDKNIN